MRVTVSVVIPALNEAENLPHVLPRIPKDVYEIVLVDGHSTDRTVEVARELVPTAKVVKQDGTGKGAALRSGFAAATGDIIVMLDADGSTDPTEIPRFVNALLAGADFVKGSRFLHGGGTADMPLHRRLGNLGFVHMVRTLYGGRYTDLCYGYNAFWRRVVPLLDLDGSGFEIETMMNIRALRTGLVVHEVPSYEARRVVGAGRLRTIPDGWRVLRTIVREYRRPVTLALRDDRQPAMVAIPIADGAAGAAVDGNGSGRGNGGGNGHGYGNGHPRLGEAQPVRDIAETKRHAAYHAAARATPVANED